MTDIATSAATSADIPTTTIVFFAILSGITTSVILIAVVFLVGKLAQYRDEKEKAGRYDYYYKRWVETRLTEPAKNQVWYCDDGVSLHVLEVTGDTVYYTRQGVLLRVTREEWQFIVDGSEYSCAR